MFILSYIINLIIKFFSIQLNLAIGITFSNPGFTHVWFVRYYTLNSILLSEFTMYPMFLWQAMTH